MGEWMGAILTACAVIAALCGVYLAFCAKIPQPDRPDVKVMASTLLDLAAKNCDLCDRIMAFTSEGREGLRHKQEIEQLRHENAEHTAWRQVAAASRLAGLNDDYRAPRVPIDNGSPDLPGYDQSPDS